MAINLFSSPADNQFISQYVQLPIQDMYNLGQIAQNEYEKTLDEQTNAINQYSQFNSTPEINNIFQKLTYDRLNDIANEASEQGIDALRDPVFRGKIRSTIRQIKGDPRVKSLYTSAQNIAERNKMVQQMMASNPNYNPNEDPYGGLITHWDPTRQGTFTDTAVQPSQSWQQLSVPIDEFLKAGKDNYLKTEGFYDIYGPDEKKYKQLSSGIAKNLMSDPRVQNKFLGSARTFAQGQGLNVDDNTALNIYSKVLSAELGKENASKSDILHHYIQKSLDNEYSNLLTTNRKVNNVLLEQWKEKQENYRARMAHQGSEGGGGPVVYSQEADAITNQAMANTMKTYLKSHNIPVPEISDFQKQYPTVPVRQLQNAYVNYLGQLANSPAGQAAMKGYSEDFIKTHKISPVFVDATDARGGIAAKVNPTYVAHRTDGIVTDQRISGSSTPLVTTKFNKDAGMILFSNQGTQELIPGYGERQYSTTRKHGNTYWNIYQRPSYVKDSSGNKIDPYELLNNKDIMLGDYKQATINGKAYITAKYYIPRTALPKDSYTKTFFTAENPDKSYVPTSGQTPFYKLDSRPFKEISTKTAGVTEKGKLIDDSANKKGYVTGYVAIPAAGGLSLQAANEAMTHANKSTWTENPTMANIATEQQP